jgi:uncharacterized protein (DUF1778 family)
MFQCFVVLGGCGWKRCLGGGGPFHSVLAATINHSALRSSILCFFLPACLRAVKTILSNSNEVRAVQMSFRSMLEALEQPITPNTDWRNIRRIISGKASVHALSEARQIEIFSELQREAIAAAKLAAEQKAEAAAAAAAAAGGSSVSSAITPSMASVDLNTEDVEVLRTFRKEQVPQPLDCYQALIETLAPL